MRLPAFLSLLALVLQEGDPHTALPLDDYGLSPDDYGEVLDLGNYEEPTDYGEQPLEVKATSPAPPPTRGSPIQSAKALRTPSSSPTVPGPPTNHSLPTCLVCVCLGSSVYCDDADLESIPPLPKTTTYLYARFNRIRRVRAGDFQGLAKLKRIDLSSNVISYIESDALRALPALQDLLLPENQLAALPALPSSVQLLDARLNRLQSSGIQPGAFRALEKLQFLYLADNLLDSVPGPLPLSLRSLHLQNNAIGTLRGDEFCDAEEHRHTRRPLEDVRLDGNPVNLSLFPDAYFCLPRLPTGRMV
uniref:Opticin n=1 Tax=Oryctolagus cuniculus TaxID=9986 RepID=G1SRM6_RABIT|nr:opticin [Oryctolagus cuniculus]XP_017203334.1 opticin [Oryctolagus cuniculus]XP_051677102.1 opticin [Oryctolagus cuniculus]